MTSNGHHVENLYYTETQDNFTTSYYFERMQEMDWIIPMAVNVVLIIITFWILISLIHFGVKTRKWKVKKQRSHSDKLNAGIVYSLTITCGTLTFVRYASSLVVMNIGFGLGKDEECDKASDIAFCTYCFVLLSVYFFLWFRQRIFYVNRIMNTTFSKTLKVFNGLSMTIIILIGLPAILFNTLPDNHPSTIYGCSFKADGKIKSAYFLTGILGLVIAQVILIALFIHPLRKGMKTKNLHIQAPRNTVFSVSEESKSTNLNHQTHTSQLNTPQKVGDSPPISTIINDIPCKNNRISNPVNNSANQRRRKKPTPAVIKSTMLRTCTFAIVSLVADIFLLVLSSYIISEDSNRRLYHMARDINTFFNLLWIILSFVDYKKMLTSPCQTYNQPSH